MSQKTPNLKQKIKRWIWVGHILFHLFKYELSIYEFKRNTYLEFGIYQPRIKDRFPVIKRCFCRSQDFVLSNKYLVNKKRFVFAKVRGNSISTMLYLIIGIKWFCEKIKINVGFAFIKRNDLFENSELELSREKHRKIMRNPTNVKAPEVLTYYARAKIPSDYGYKIISKLKIKEELQQQADAWINNNLRGDWLAVHYRGTDTRTHATSRVIEIENYIAYLKEVLDDHSSILACSDQSQFIDQMQATFPGRVFSRDIQRSDDKTPLHKSPKYKGNQQKRDALIDLLVLSRASLIYTTGSYFIDVLRFFNPKIKIISLDNRRKFYKNIPNYLPIPNLSALKRGKYEWHS